MQRTPERDLLREIQNALSHHIENFNKKALYILIREMSGSNTQHITRVINAMKRKQNALINDFRDKGISFKNNVTGSVFT